MRYMFYDCAKGDGCKTDQACRVTLEDRLHTVRRVCGALLSPRNKRKSIGYIFNAGLTCPLSGRRFFKAMDRRKQDD